MSAAVQLLMLTRYGPLGASSRVRMLAYREALEAQGFSVSVQSLLSDDYLRRLYAGTGRDGVQVSAAYWRRVRDLLGRRRPALVWLPRPYLPVRAARAMPAPPAPAR